MKYIVSKSPFRTSRMEYRNFDELLDGVFGGSVPTTARTPKVDVQEDEEQYILKADMPGLSREEIEVKVENHVLTFSSVSTQEREKSDEEAGESGNAEGNENGDKGRNEKRQYLLRERSRPAYSRSFTLPRDADAGAIEAQYSGGVLTLSIKKAEEAKPRNITVNAQ